MKIFVLNIFLCFSIIILFLNSCKRKDKDCDVPIIIDSIKCTTNLSDTFQIEKYDSVKFLLDYYSHLQNGYWCNPNPVMNDRFNSIIFISKFKYGNYNAGDTINNILNKIIYYYTDKRGNVTYYSYNSLSDFFQSYNNPPVYPISFNLSLPPDTTVIFELKCIVKLNNNKEFSCFSKPIKITP